MRKGKKKCKKRKEKSREEEAKSKNSTLFHVSASSNKGETLSPPDPDPPTTRSFLLEMTVYEIYEGEMGIKTVSRRNNRYGHLHLYSCENEKKRCMI